MTPGLRRMLALWAGVLAAAVCLGYLPVSRRVGVFTLLVLWCVIAAVWFVTRRRHLQEEALSLTSLPDNAYRQPVVLVCGDLPQEWPADPAVLTVAQGCWIHVPDPQQLALVARQLLWQRPGWGRQLSVMVTVCPQKHHDTEALASTLLALRWQISQIRRESGQTIPLVLSGLAGSVMMKDMLWQAGVSNEPVSVWRESPAPDSIAAWVTTGGAMALQQQVMINSLMAWFHSHVDAVFTQHNPDIPAVLPTARLWGLCPYIAGAQPDSAWQRWLQRHTALSHVAGWMPAESNAGTLRFLPDFVLPLLPEGNGITPGQRAGRYAWSLFTLAAIAALCSSGWNNHHLLQRIAFDIRHYDQILMDDYAPKADAVEVLRQDAWQLDQWARNGEPLRLGLGLYQGAHLHIPLLDAIRTYVSPPHPAPAPEAPPAPTIVRLDSMSLFDSGKSALKPGSTKMLVNSLVGIKAKPGWLIVVSGHTDSTGNPTLNQRLSRGRAESVRDWMRDTGDVPESCFAVQGYGAARPIASNDTPDGRAQNRRVEISLVPQADACQIPDTKPASPDERDVLTQEMEK